MKKKLSLVICLVFLCLAGFSTVTAASAEYFTPSVSVAGTKVSTASYKAAKKAKHYSHIRVNLSVTYMRGGNGSGSYSMYDNAYSSSNNPNEDTNSVRAIVKAKNNQDYRLNNSATGNKWWTAVNN